MSLAGFVKGLARWLAILGGVVLVVITIITVVSITGRSLIWAGLRPVPGDFELVEAGVGFAVFAFLPWCQLNRGHATVDIFTSVLPAQVNRHIDVVAEVLMTIAITFIAWRLWFGLQDKIRYGETTFILQFPVWWSFAACMVAAAIAVVVSFYMVGVRLAELRSDDPVPKLGEGGGTH
jgi:TRAP-type C4-dicarboxylate transport system permease small subunit